jgi:hypothetical protein
MRPAQINLSDLAACHNNNYAIALASKQGLITSHLPATAAA